METAAAISLHFVSIRTAFQCPPSPCPQSTLKSGENQSLIDELNGTVATLRDSERERVLERIADLFAAGARGYSGELIALFDDVLQKLSADIEERRGQDLPAGWQISTTLPPG